MLPLPIISFRNKNHERDKEQLLELINQQKSKQYVDKIDSIGNTDWYDESHTTPYWDLFYNSIKDDLEEVYVNKLLYVDYKLDNKWFQQYYTNDTHGWHWHQKTFYNNVYFLELPEDAPPTELQIPVTGDIIKPQIKEGDILVFPSILRHRSAPNLSNGRKTVIAFNIF
jgi:hypothetical protein